MQGFFQGDENVLNSVRGDGHIGSNILIATPVYI